MLDRLHKILARAGVAALRPAEDMILQGRVTVNGRIVRELGARADPVTDVIAVDGQLIHVPVASDPHRYYMLHKPAGVISTAQDTHDRATVLELVPSDVRVFSVGRLDADSEGLMLLTDDGDLAYRLTHPRFQVDKEYRVLVDHTPDLDTLRHWRSGVELPTGENTARAWAEVLERSPDGTWLRVVLHEGKKRQIREVARVLGLHVLRLIRVREGPLTLGDLPPGAWRELTRAEVDALRAHTQHVPSREADEERERKMSEDEERRPRRLRVIRRPAREEISRMPGAQGQDEEPTAGVAPAWEMIGEDADVETAQTAPEPDREPAQPDSGRARDEQRTGGFNRAPADGPRRYEGERRPGPSGRDYPRRDDRQSSGPPRAGNDDRRGFGRQSREAQGGAPGQRDDRRGVDQRPPQRDDRRGFGQRDDQRGFGQRGERSDFQQRDDRRGGFGQRDDRQGGFGQRDDRQGSGQRDDRPQFRQGPPRDGGRSFDRGHSGDPRDNQRGGGFRQDDRGGPARGGFRDGPQRNDVRGGPPREGFRGPPREGFRGPPREGFRGPPREGFRGPPREGFRGPPREGFRGPPREGFRGPPRDDRQPDRFGGQDAPERGNERDAPERPRSFGDRSRGFGDRSRGFGDRSRSSGGERSAGGGSRGGPGRGFGRRPADSSRGPDGLPRRDSQGQFRGPTRDRDEGRRGPGEGNSFNRSSGPSGEGASFGRRRSGPPSGRPFNSRSSGPSRGGPARGPRTGQGGRPGTSRRRRDDD